MRIEVGFRVLRISTGFRIITKTSIEYETAWDVSLRATSARCGSDARVQPPATGSPDPEWPTPRTTLAAIDQLQFPFWHHHFILVCQTNTHGRGKSSETAESIHQ